MVFRSQQISVIRNSFSHFLDTFITSRFPRYQGLHETAGGETLKSRLAMNRFSPKHPRPMHNLKNYLHSALPKCTPRLLRLDGDVLASIVSVLFFRPKDCLKPILRYKCTTIQSVFQWRQCFLCYSSATLVLRICPVFFVKFPSCLVRNHPWKKWNYLFKRWCQNCYDKCLI